MGEVLKILKIKVSEIYHCCIDILMYVCLSVYGRSLENYVHRTGAGDSCSTLTTEV